MPSNQEQALAIVLLIVTILHHNNIRFNHFLRRKALVHPRFSPWARLLNCGDESSFLALTGFNYRSFNLMLDILKPAVDFVGQLGLFLFFCNSNLKMKHLCMHMLGCDKQDATACKAQVGQASRFESHISHIS